MGYERNDGRYGRDYGYARDRQTGYRGYRDQDRAPRGYEYDDRGFLDRAGDEVRSWFGDEEAERRRRYDQRYDERYTYRDEDGYRPGYDVDAGGYREYGTRASGGSGASGGGFGAQTYSGGYGGVYGGYAGAYGGSRAREREIQRRADAHEQSYHSWRDRQIDALDRDYDDYRRENQSRFDSEFATWRNRRGEQRNSLTRVTEHQEVVGSDGEHVGKVDKVRGDRILLTKTDKDAGGHHHSIPSSWIVSVADKVTIDRTGQQAKDHWRDEENNRAFWNDRDDRERSDSPHYLNRAFSGTY